MRAKVVFRKDIGKFVLDYSDPITGRRTKKTFPHKAAADLALKAVSVSQVEHKHFNVKDEKPVLFTDMLDKYLVWSRANKRSWKTDVCLLASFREQWGSRLMNEITPHMVETYKAERRVAVSAHTVNHELTALAGVFNRAADGTICEPDERFVGTNPCRNVKRYALPKFPIERYLSGDEETRLLKACADMKTDNKQASHLWHIVEVGLNTGLRRAELLGLAWDDVDYKANILRVKDSKSEGKGKRTIPLNDRLKAALEDLWLARQMAPDPKSAWVFDKGGKPFVEVKRGFKSACRAAGVANFRFHDLRHTFASKLVGQGVPLLEVSQLLGHTSLDMTMRYAHLSPDHLKRAVQKLDPAQVLS